MMADLGALSVERTLRSANESCANEPCADYELTRPATWQPARFARRPVPEAFATRALGHLAEDAILPFSAHAGTPSSAPITTGGC